MRDANPVPRSGPLEIRVRTTPLEFDELQHEWSPLLQASGSDNPFLDWDWVRTWWDVFGAAYRLQIVEARTADGALVAIAPLKIADRAIHTQVAEFLGQGGDVTPEYLDFIVRRGWERHALGPVIERVLRDSGIDGFDLRALPVESPNREAVRESLNGSGRLWELEDSVCPVLQLPSTWDEFLQCKSRNYRKKLGEFERRCQRELDLRLRRGTEPEELDRDMDILVQLHRKRWGHRSRAFATTGYNRFHRRLARRLLDRGRLRLFILQDGDRPIASLYCFRHGDTVYYYQAGRDPEYARYRVGLVLMHWVIRESIAEGATVFDFLTGREEYKNRWAEGYLRNVRVVYWRKRLRKWISATRWKLVGKP